MTPVATGLRRAGDRVGRETLASVEEARTR